VSVGLGRAKSVGRPILRSVGKTRRWIGLVRYFEPFPQELIDPIQREDDAAIVTWIRQQLDVSRQEFADFRLAHERLDRLLRRVERDVDRRLLGEEEDEDVGGLYREIEVEQEIEHSSRISVQESVELDWYRDQLRGHSAVIRTWRRRLEVALDIAEIQSMRDPYDVE
jgi:hypothetical protein